MSKKPNFQNKLKLLAAGTVGGFKKLFGNDIICEIAGLTADEKKAGIMSENKRSGFYL